MTEYIPVPGEHISQAAEAAQRLADANGAPVSLAFNGVPLQAGPGGCAATLVAAYEAECERRSEEYRNSPEGRRAAREAEEHARTAAKARAGGLPEFAFRPDGGEEAWQQSVAANPDGYGQGVLRYAARWAALMERELREGAQVADIADRLSDVADLEGVSGFMHGCARSLLKQCWAHGDELP